MNPIGLTFLAAVCVVKLVHGASVSIDEADLLGLESADAAVSIPGLAALDLSSGLPVLPLAPQKFRPKRKPQRFRFAGERPSITSRFKPRGRLTLSQDAESKNEVESEESIVQTTTAPETTEPTQKTSFLPQFRRKLPSFPKRTRPTIFDATTLPTTEAPTTTEPVITVTERLETTRFQALEDLFGTAGNGPRQQEVFQPQPRQQQAVFQPQRRQQQQQEVFQPQSRQQQEVFQPQRRQQQEVFQQQQQEVIQLQPRQEQAVFEPQSRQQQQQELFEQQQEEVIQQKQQLALLDELVQETGPVALPPIVSNSVEDGGNLLEEVRARTVAITGAQPVGVTRNVSARGKSARLLKATGPRREATGPRRGSTGRRNKLRTKGQAGGQRRAPASDFQVAEDQRVLDTTVQDLELAAERRVAVAPAPTVPPTGLALRKGGLTGNDKQRTNDHKIGTVERYKFENEDGSITWGYENEDGSYKEESIGVDCITRGKYGYIDPTGEVREYSYSSGVKCDPLTRKVESENNNNSGNGDRGLKRLGKYDYQQNKFIMPDGRKVRVVVNQKNRARGRRH